MLPKFKVILLTLTLLISGCEGESWNDPYPQYNGNDNTLYTAFFERPKHLDPALAYNENEALILSQIYETPLQYSYLKRPYQLEPLVATQLPTLRYIKKGDEVEFSIIQITIKPHIYYQQHPAFAKVPGTDNYRYLDLTPEQVAHKHTIQDFQYTATRELIAEDFVYQIKRLADPTLNSPIFGFMENYIVGFKDFSAQLQKAYANAPTNFLDLRTQNFAGAKVIDRYTYEITIKGKYPQFSYWLAMPFFAPMPWEAIKFYSQPLLIQKNISLDWYPLGSGPFILKENNPNLRMVLEKNPDFHGETYPTYGVPGDEEKGLLKMRNKPLPFLDKVVFVLEKESIPYWSKFLQGYYDQSNVVSDNFDQALKAVGSGLELSDELKAKGVSLTTSVSPSIFYWGFNMLDETVGGYTQKQRDLRKALSLAMDMQEYINIFTNGNGIVAQSPLAPGIFGYQADRPMQDHAQALQTAKLLLAQAGYPKGVDSKTHHPLVLYYDAIMSASSEAQAQFSWMRKQFKKLGINLVVRATQYNRFQDKMRNGDEQIYFWGWNADYPDPENFLFLLYGPNSKVEHDGENASNYANAAFDALFEKMKRMDNSPQREAIIKQMLAILDSDTPWLTGYHPKSFTLRQAWVAPFKPNAMSRNTLKYISIDPVLREKLRLQWNRATVWPLWVALIILILLCIPAGILYWQKNHKSLILEKRKKLKDE